MWLVEAAGHPELVRHVAQRMRPWDQREIFATRLDDDVDAFCLDVLACGPVSWVAGLEEPIVAVGAAPMWNGVWSLWMFATDAINKVGFPVTKFVKRHMVPMLIENGAHRLECRSMEGHIDAQDWLKVLGASREATLKGYGRAGEDFHVYTWETR